MPPTGGQERAHFDDEISVRGEVKGGELQIIVEQSVACERQQMINSEIYRVRDIPESRFSADIAVAGLLMAPASLSVAMMSVRGDGSDAYAVFMVTSPGLLVGPLYALAAHGMTRRYPEREAVGVQSFPGSWEPYDCANYPVAGILAQVLIDGEAIFGGNTASDGSVTIALDTVRDAIDDAKPGEPLRL